MADVSRDADGRGAADESATRADVADGSADRGGRRVSTRVRRRRDRDDRRPGGTRGQLFLVTALALAVAFVGLALLLNTAIYTENLATRNADPGAEDVLGYRSSVEAGVGGLVDAVNRHNDASYEALSANLTAGVDDWSDTAAVHRAARGTGANVSLEGVENGTRIAQTERDRNFTNRTGAADWTLVEDAPALRAFRLNVSRENLTESTLADLPAAGDSVYHIDLTDDDETRTVYLYQNGTADEVRVAVETESGSFSDACAATAGADGHVVVDVTAATVGGDDCGALSFVGDLSGDLDVTFGAADAATGTYGLVVSSEFGAVFDPAHVYDADSAAESPFATEAIYAATAGLTYENADVTYRTTLRVAPGEPP